MQDGRANSQPLAQALLDAGNGVPVTYGLGPVPPKSMKSPDATVASKQSAVVEKEPRVTDAELESTGSRLRAENQFVRRADGRGF